MKNKPIGQKPIRQFTTVHHMEYGKGHIVGITPKGRDSLCMCYFPKAKEHDWVLISSLQKNTDDLMSLEPMTPQDDMVSDDLKDLITQAFFGGQPPPSR